MIQQTPTNWRERHRRVGRFVAFALIGACLAAGIAFSMLFVVSGLWGVADRIGESPTPTFGRGGDPLQAAASGIVRAMFAAALIVVAALAGAVMGYRFSLKTDATIPTDHWPMRLLVVVHFGFLWFVLYEGYSSMVRGPAPPDGDGGLIIGVASLLLMGLPVRQKNLRVAIYLGVTGLLLCFLTWSGRPIENSDHMAKLLQAVLLVIFTASASGWAWWLLSRPFRDFRNESSSQISAVSIRT